MPKLKWKTDCDKINKTTGLNNSTCLVLETNIWKAFTEQMYNQLGDKTFVLIIIFTISWSNWHLDLDEREDEKVNEDTPEETKEFKIETQTKDLKDEDKEEETNEDDLNVFNASLNEGGDSEDDELAKLIVKKKAPIRNKNVVINPIRIYISATLGLMIANIFSIQF